jgi:AraC-like DNA-binding protein
VDNVFSSLSISNPAQRFSAWQAALCDVYVRVDTKSDRAEDYNGHVNRVEMAPLIITDALLGKQTITRNNSHIHANKKDCFYIQIVTSDQIILQQHGMTVPANNGVCTIFRTNEAYSLQCGDGVRALYVEVPTHELSTRLGPTHEFVSTFFSTRDGLGRLVRESMLSIAADKTPYKQEVKERLGRCALDLIALTIDSSAEFQPENDRAVQHFRLAQLKSYIEVHLTSPLLTCEKVAKDNGISLRYLHKLFKVSDMSVTEWIRERRLARSYQLLSSDDPRFLSITDLAFAMGFNSSSHFSSLFHQRYGVRPSDIRARGSLPRR